MVGHNCVNVTLTLHAMQFVEQEVREIVEKIVLENRLRTITQAIFTVFYWYLGY
jgi:hypothetical protein